METRVGTGGSVGVGAAGDWSGPMLPAEVRHSESLVSVVGLGLTGGAIDPPHALLFWSSFGYGFGFESCFCYREVKRLGLGFELVCYREVRSDEAETDNGAPSCGGRGGATVRGREGGVDLSICSRARRVRFYERCR